MECSFCKKTFSSKSNLSAHIKTAKYCLEMQGKNDSNYECEFCNKILSQKATLHDHLSVCKERYKKLLEKQEYEFKSVLKKLEDDSNEMLLKKMKEKDIYYQERLQEKDDYITKLESRLDKFENVITNMASEPKTLTTNNTNSHNNTVYMNKFDINDTKQIGNVIQKYLTKDVIARGQEGIALMLGEYLLKGPNGEPLYECTDVARQKFEFVNADGNVETDPKATKLIRSINNSGLCQQATVAANDLWTNPDGRMDTEKYGVYAGKVTEVMQLEKDSTKLRNKLASVTVRQKHSKNEKKC